MKKSIGVFLKLSPFWIILIIYFRMTLESLLEWMVFLFFTILLILTQLAIFATSALIKIYAPPKEEEDYLMSQS